MLALGDENPGVEIVDLRRMRKVGAVKLPAPGWVTFLSWQHGYLFAVVSRVFPVPSRDLAALLKLAMASFTS